MGTNKKEQENAEISFGETASKWLELKKLSVKPSTAVKYKNILEKNILPKIGDILLTELTTWDVEMFAMEQLREGRIDGNGGLSVQSVRFMLGVIGAVLQYAQWRDVFSSCRVREIQIKSLENSAKVISGEMQNRLERYLLSHITRKNTGILISLYMGVRLGEICALRWESIDLENRIIKIAYTMQRIQNFEDAAEHKTMLVVMPPKSTSSMRELPIPTFLLNILRGFSGHHADYYFLSDSADKVVEPRSFQRHFKKILKITQLENVNYHALRHTFATRCIEEGFDMKTLSEILGHSSISITMNRYVHTSMEQKRKNMLKLDVPLSFK